MKYVAVKVKGIAYWFWFEKKKTSETDGMFKGFARWGKRGALTGLECSLDQLEGRIESDALQY